jgi:hypothetical protein
VFWSPKIIKVDFEAAVVSATNKVFLDSVITGCNFHFNQCLWRQIQNSGLTVEYKENELMSSVNTRRRNKAASVCKQMTVQLTFMAI